MREEHKTLQHQDQSFVTDTQTHYMQQTSPLRLCTEDAGKHESKESRERRRKKVSDPRAQSRIKIILKQQVKQEERTEQQQQQTS